MRGIPAGAMLGKVAAPSIGGVLGGLFHGSCAGWTRRILVHVGDRTPKNVSPLTAKILNPQPSTLGVIRGKAVASADFTVVLLQRVYKMSRIRLFYLFV